MERWKRYSSNPLERIKIVRTKYSPIVKCLNCGRILTGEFVIHCNDEGYQTCPCGCINFFTLIGDFTWEVCLIKIKPKESKKKLPKQLKLLV